MPGPKSSGRVIYRFGAFELDVDNRELRNQGTPIKLQDQPFRILAYLVMRAGSLVTREELTREMWPEGTFVEFEHSLDTAVKKVRQALGVRRPGRPNISRLSRGMATDSLHRLSRLAPTPSLLQLRDL